MAEFKSQSEILTVAIETIEQLTARLENVERDLSAKADKSDVDQLRNDVSSLQLAVCGPNDARNISHDNSVSVRHKLEHDEMSDQAADENAATNAGTSDTLPQTSGLVRDNTEEQEASQMHREGATSARNDGDKPLNEQQPSTSQNDGDCSLLFLYISLCSSILPSV